MFASEMIPLLKVSVIFITNMFLLKRLYYTVIISNTLYYVFQYSLQSLYYIYLSGAEIPVRAAYLFS